MEQLLLLRLAAFLWMLCAVGSQDTEESGEFELTPQDGWFNNLLHPNWGGIDGQLLRRSPPAYSDGVYDMAGQDRPNPFDISDSAHKGEAGLSTKRNRTAFMVYFGQQVVEEVLDSQRPGCPREFENIKVPKNHKLNPNNIDDFEMPFIRTRFDQATGYSSNNPRQQLNEITPYLDGGLMYGTSKAWTDAIREFSDRNGRKGRLLARDEDLEKDIKETFPAKNKIRLPFANPPPPREHVLKPVNRFWCKTHKLVKPT